MRSKYFFVNLSIKKDSLREISSSEQECILFEIYYNNIIGYGVTTKLKDSTLRNQNIIEYFDFCSKVVRNYTPFDHHLIIATITAKFNYQDMISAVDMALYDLRAKIAKLPLHKFLGLNTDKKLQTSISIAHSSPKTILDTIKQHSQYPVIKLKIKEFNEQLFVEIGKIFQGNIYIDANEGFGIEQLNNILPVMQNYNISIIEQPFKRNININDLKHLHNYTDIKIFIDESCCNINDIISLHPYIDGVNLKLNKCGGISKVLEMITLASKLNLKIMLGSTTNSILASICCAHLAQLVDYLDLDGHLVLKNDLFQHINFTNGFFNLSENYGIGCIKI